MSSVADYPMEDVKSLAAEAKRRKKMFALHAGEKNAEVICFLKWNSSRRFFGETNERC